MADTQVTELMDIKGLAAYLKIKPSTVMAWRISRSDFPQPLELGRKTLRWQKSKIDQWLNSLPVAGKKPAQQTHTPHTTHTPDAGVAV